MKQFKSIVTIILPTLILAACGDYQKNPVDNLEEIRAKGKAEQELGPQKPKEIVKWKDRPVAVPVEQGSINSNFVTITEEATAGQKDTSPDFYEGQTKSLAFRVRTSNNGIKVKLTIQEKTRPQGAEFKQSTSDKDVYLLTWTPAPYTVGNGEKAAFVVKLSAVLESAATKQLETQFKSVTHDKEVRLYVFKQKVAVPTHKVEGLPSEIKEGDIVTFTVTAVVPGVDDKSKAKPVLSAYYDGKNLTGDNSFQELDGYKYLNTNPSEPQYVGNYTWKFTRLFDTKNNAVDVQLAKDGSVMKNSDGTRVRVSFKVKSPLYDFVSAESVSLIKITYNKPASAPRFDLVGLGQPKLVVNPGQKTTLNFVVTSAEKTAKVQVSTAPSKLAGSPAVVCKDSKEGSFKQDCTMTWEVPCDAAKDQITGTVQMSAVAIVNGQNSDETRYDLAVEPNKVDQKLCVKENK
jgi:hypothetical protein